MMGDKIGKREDRSYKILSDVHSFVVCVCVCVSVGPLAAFVACVSSLIKSSTLTADATKGAG